MCEIDSPWFERIPMHNIEKKALQENTEEIPYGKNRRFACSFELEDWMDEMFVRVKFDLKWEKKLDQFEEEKETYITTEN